MANKTYKDMDFKIDGSGGTLASIKAYLNQTDLNRTLSLIEDTAMGSVEKTFIPGLAGNDVIINGLVNTTTDGIFGPLINAATSVSKTFEWKAYASRFYNGEVFVSDVKYSGKTNSLETFSANLTISGTVNRTSVALT